MKISPPAFPTYLAENMAHGMTLRDYFAASVLGKLIELELNLSKEYQQDISFIAQVAYALADKMLKERDQ